MCKVIRLTSQSSLILLLFFKFFHGLSWFQTVYQFIFLDYYVEIDKFLVIVIYSFKLKVLTNRSRLLLYDIQ